uniref:long-chain-fatty-acid--CoA ligase n=1 Tax=Glossina palpalis gambiensis TaxID=67801 RepID=A0A1B0B0P5_9MUSC
MQILVSCSVMSSVRAAVSYTSSRIQDAVKLRLDKEDLTLYKIQTIPEVFEHACKRHGGMRALAFKSVGTSNDWRYMTYKEYSLQVDKAVLLLLRSGIRPRTTVAILSSNCSEWLYIEMAALKIGAVVMGIYPTSSTKAVHYKLKISEAFVCAVDTIDQMAKVNEVALHLPDLKAVIVLGDAFEYTPHQNLSYYHWTDLIDTQFTKDLEEKFLEYRKAVYANECAILVFTSGTTGMPKGVMLSHDNIITSVRKVLTLVKLDSSNLVSYLPLNHVAAQMFEVFFGLMTGSCLHFVDREAIKGRLVDALIHIKPAMMFGVPRIFEKIRDKILYEKKKSNQDMDCIKTNLGFENLKTFIVGAASSDPELKRFYLDIEMPLMDAFGLSETSGGVTLNKEFNNFQTVGKPISGLEIKINKPDKQDEGEIFLRGRNVFMGYLNNENKTQETIQADGWLRTGDLGYLDPNGCLFLKGRIKDIIVTSGGENVPPLRIEQIIKKELPCVSNAFVVGDGRKYLTVLLTFKTFVDVHSDIPLDDLSPETVDWFKSLDFDFKYLSEVLNAAKLLQPSIYGKIMQALESGLKKANDQALCNSQKVQYFTVLPNDFSVPTGELGPTLKVKRNVVLEKNKILIDKMYSENASNKFAV